MPKLSAKTLGEAVDVAALREANARLQKDLIKAKDKTRLLVDAVTQAAYNASLAAGPIVPVKAPKPDKRDGRPEAAVWVLTDWQGAKVTTSYNSAIMEQRVGQFVDKAEAITTIQRADHPVRECVILFGGDMGEGLFNFPTQPFEIDQTIFGQYVTVSRTLVMVVRRALAIYDRVLVVAEWGNHGRIGSKRSAVPRADNFDRMSYELARQLLIGEKRLTWEDCPEDIQRVEIGNYRALLIHGDEIGRNGFASKNTIVQHCNNWRSGSYPWEFRDVYVNHYHTHYEEAMSNGEGSVFGTGSTESDNRYASVSLASSATPSQRLNFIDPEKGRVTAQYKVWLD